MKRSELLDAIEQAYHQTGGADFPDVETALEVAASALKYLTDQCEADDDPKGS